MGDRFRVHYDSDLGKCSSDYLTEDELGYTIASIMRNCTTNVHVTVHDSKELKGGPKFVVGDKVFVSNLDVAYEENIMTRDHKNFFGTVTEVEHYDKGYIVTVLFAGIGEFNTTEWRYEEYELTLASELDNLTLKEFSEKFGVEVLAQYIQDPSGRRHIREDAIRKAFDALDLMSKPEHVCGECKGYFRKTHELCYRAETGEVCRITPACEKFVKAPVEEEEYVPSATNGDYSPSAPWNAPGMSMRDFI